MATIAVYKYHDCAKLASKSSPRSIAHRLVPITTQPQTMAVQPQISVR